MTHLYTKMAKNTLIKLLYTNEYMNKYMANDTVCCILAVSYSNWLANDTRIDVIKCMSLYKSFLETWLNMFIAMAQTVHHLYLQPMIICSSAQTMRISYVVWVHYTHYTQKPCLLITLIKSVNSDVNDVWRTLVPWSRHGPSSFWSIHRG